MLGDRVGAYRLLSKLGEGGMGVVYVGEHMELGQRVAIKLLLPELSQDQEIVQRFFNEARAATRIKHPGIVQVMDFGRHASGAAYFAMELLEGESLSSRLRRVRMLGVQQLALLGRQACNALAAAHAQGIVHRDLKPDNLMLVPDPDVVGGERVKVLDFGIAKLAAEAQGVSLKTKTGSVMGTPYYMSPEQCRGAGEVDWRSDIYSMGCILYEMATGTPPFRGEGFGEVVGQHQFVAPVPPRQLANHVTPQLEAIILRALAKQAGQRQQSMQELGNELAALAGPGMVSAPVPVPQPPRITEPEPMAAAMASQRARSGLGVATTMGSAAGQQLAAGSGLGPAGSGPPSAAMGMAPAAAPRSKAPVLALLGVILVGGGAAAYFATRGGGGGGGGGGGQPAGATAGVSPGASASGASSAGAPTTAPAKGAAAKASADLTEARAAIAAERWSDALASAVQALRQEPGNEEARVLQSQAERELRAQIGYEMLQKQAAAKDFRGVLEAFADLDPASVYRDKAAASVAEARRAVLASALEELRKLGKGHKCREARAAAERAKALLPDDAAALDAAAADCSAGTVSAGGMGNKDAPPGLSPSPSPGRGQPDEVACLLDPTLAGCKRRGTGKSTPAVDTPSRDGLTGQQIKEGIGTVRGAVDACFAKYQVPGTVKVKLSIAPTGKVTSAQVVGDLAGTPTGACVASAATRASFDRFSGPPVSVNYPFVLR